MIEQYGHGGDVWTAAEEFGVDRTSLLDLSANINPLGPPPSIWEALEKAKGSITAYPDPRARDLRQVLAAHTGLTGEHLVVGNGAAEVLYGVMRALLPQKVGLIQPCFSEYEEAARVAGAELCQVTAREEDDFLPNLPDLLALCEAVDLLVVGYPNNPNGRLLPFGWLTQMAEVLGRRGKFLLVDEAFLDFLPDAPTLADAIDEWPQVILLRSMTKFYSIPGLRLGYALAVPELAGKIQRELPPWGVNSLAQAAGIAGLLDREFAVRTAAWLTEARAHLIGGLRAIPGVKVYHGEVNYVLFRCEAEELQHKLGRQGILIRSCAAYPGLGPGFYRVAVRTLEDNASLLTAMRAVAEGV